MNNKRETMHPKHVFSIIIVITKVVISAAASFDALPSIHYEETPLSQKAVLHDPALLRCVAASSVERCRWTWRSFDSLANVQPIVVREFEAFGPNGRDCSVRFRSLLPEHEGEWTCAILEAGSSKYIEAPTALIRVAHSDGVQFSAIPEPTQVQAGEAATLRCVVQQGIPVEWCRWTWRPLRQPNTPRIPVKEFPPFGNESRDCSVRFRAAQPEQSGEWSCGVRPRGQLNFQPTQPASLTVLRREMKFVQLSQDLQVAAGETVLLRCVTAAHVHRCRWLWRPFDSPNAAQQAEPVEVKNFAAFGDDSRDCSVRFSSVLPEQAGEWTCGVKPDSEGAFQDAPPARLTLLPAVKIRFVDLPENRRVASGSTVSLPCSVTSGVALCRWILTPVNVIDVPQYPIEFAGQGNWSRDCTLTLKDVQPAHEGLWTCSVLGPPSTDTLYSAPPVKLEVYQPVIVEFTELSQAIQMPTGSPVLLRCVTTQHVQQCRWLKSSNDDFSEGTQEEDTLKEFEPLGDENNDCSMRFSAVSSQQSGEWTCSVRPVGETEFQAAPASRLTVLPPGWFNKHVPTAFITQTQVTGWFGLQPLLRNEWQVAPRLPETSRLDWLTILVCVSDRQSISSCRWIGPQGLLVRPRNNTSRYTINSRLWATADFEAGICTLSIENAGNVPEVWRCCLTMETSEGIEFQVEMSTIFNSTIWSAKNSTTSTIMVLLTMVIIGLTVLLAISLIKVNCQPNGKTAATVRIDDKQQVKKQRDPHGSSAKKVRFSTPLADYSTCSSIKF